MVLLTLFCLFLTVVADYDSQSMQSRILYGQVARIEDHPFFAGLSNCGAVILSDVWILTAAHCIRADNLLKFVWVGGETYKNSIIIPYSHSMVHEGYREVEGVPIDDIALIKLSTPLKFSSKVRPIKLPLGGSEQKSSTSSTRLLLVARGKDETGQIAQSLQKADLVRLTPDQCISQIPKVWLDKMGRENVEYLQKANICAKRDNGGPAICNGDSGSPLVSGDTLVGIVSYIGYQDCFKPRLGFYVNVQFYLPWIRMHTGL